MLINSYDDTITIDLNGKTLTNNGDTTISNGGFLVLEDSVGNGNAGVVLNKNYLRLRGGTIVHLIHDAPSVINGGHVENLSLLCRSSGLGSREWNYHRHLRDYIQPRR